MVSNNNISSPSNKSSTTSEDEVYTPANSTSPVTGNVPPSSPPAKQSSASNKPDKELPAQTEQTPARFLAGCSKLDLEPNPFEQSFSHVPMGESSGTNSPKPSLPPVASIASPSAGVPSSEGQYEWDSLRSGPLSPSMLQGPQNPSIFEDMSSNTRTGNTSLPYSTFPEASPRSAALFGVNSGITMPVVNLSNLEFGSKMYPQGVSRPFTDAERSKTNPTTNTTAATTAVLPNVTNMGIAVSANRPATVQSSVPVTASASNVLVTSQMTTQPIIINGQNTLTNIQQTQEPQRRRNSIALPDAVLTKTEKEDFASLVNNGLISSRNHRYSNGMSANASVAASASTASSDDGFEDDLLDNMDPLRTGASSSSKNTTRSGRRKAEDNIEDQPPSKKNHQNKVKNDLTDEEKRRNFLERNRQAALKCRQRKKQWLANLQAKVEYLTQDNENLRNQTASLRDEVLSLKTLLIAHKDCPITQAQGGVLMGIESMQNVGSIPQSIAVGPPGGVSMGVGVGMVSNSMQGNVSGSNVPGIAMSHVQPHMNGRF